jgi:hypothetical protein
MATAKEALQHGDVKARLRDIINDHSSAKVKAGKYQHSGDSYVDHDGDGSEGNVTYYCKGDLRQAPYELGATSGGNAAGNIDFGNSKNVIPQTTYVPEADDSENYTAMEAAPLLQAELYTDIPAYHLERYISTKTRKSMDSADFAGKGTSFPIKTGEDVSAALASIGRAGTGNYSGDTIRKNIKAIAKRKGLPLPDSLKDASDKEAWSTWKPEGTLLLESAAFLLELPRLQEGASASYPIKLMSPGRGSSGFYPAAVLKKAAEANVFKAGTQMFWNHDTDAEESARPEGDLNRLAAVTTRDAKWDEAGKDGPGLYAHAKVFADYADKVKEMGPHIGLSIRAGGDRDESAKGPDGKPRVITALRNAASVDFVTKAGRDGKIFTEAARLEGDDMDKNEVLALIKEAQAPILAENKMLRDMLSTVKARPMITERLVSIRLPEHIKTKITESIAAVMPLDANGTVDAAKLDKMIEAQATEWAETLVALGHNVNPAAIGKPVKEADVLEMAKSLDAESDEIMEGLAEIFVGSKIPKGSGDDAKRQLRKEARKAFREGRAA